MNTFTLLTFLGGFGVIVSFFSGVRAVVRNGEVGHRCSAEWMAWRTLFYLSVFLTILAGPLSR